MSGDRLNAINLPAADQLTVPDSTTSYYRILPYRRGVSREIDDKFLQLRVFCEPGGSTLGVPPR